MKIDRIYVAGFRHDAHFTRACVASIRCWYSSIPITLIKDRFYGDYSTRDIEKYYGCDVFPSDGRVYGWGMGKLEPLFCPDAGRFLVLDSDIVFLGPVLGRLSAIAADFVVQFEDPSPEFITKNYFDLDRLRAADPDFEFPGYTFNTGQWVGTGGLISRDDLRPWLDRSNPPAIREPAIFKLGEQGLFNYIVMKAAAAGRLSVARERFMEVGDSPAVLAFDLVHGSQAQPPFLVHWCGLRQSRFSTMVRGDLLLHFERLYYSRIPFGHLRRVVAAALRESLNLLRREYRRLRRWAGAFLKPRMLTESKEA
jgi:hypothetical protein